MVVVYAASPLQLFARHSCARVVIFWCVSVVGAVIIIIVIIIIAQLPLHLGKETEEKEGLTKTQQNIVFFAKVVFCYCIFNFSFIL